MFIVNVTKFQKSKDKIMKEIKYKNTFIILL